MDAAQRRIFDNTGIEVARDPAIAGFVTIDTNGPKSLDREQASALANEVLLCAYPPKPEMTRADWRSLVEGGPEEES